MAYGKEYKEEVLSRFHASGMSMRAACSSLEGFPCAATLSAFAREEGAGLLRPPALAVPGRCEGRRAWEPYPLGTKREAMRLLAGAWSRASSPGASGSRAPPPSACGPPGWGASTGSTAGPVPTASASAGKLL